MDHSMKDWRTYDYAPSAMLQYLVKDRKVAAKIAGVRKLRLAMVGVCRQIWNYIPELEHRKAVEIAEAFADKLIKPATFDSHRKHYENALKMVVSENRKQIETWNRNPGPDNLPKRHPHTEPLELAVRLLSPNNAARELITAISPADQIWRDAHPIDPDWVARTVKEVVFTEDEAAETMKGMERGVIRDVFGESFRRIIFNPTWRTSTVSALARQIYDSRNFATMPILADALEDTGCRNEDILEHCRSAGPHVRGCWVVDLVLGKG